MAKGRKSSATIAKERLALIRDVFETCFRNTESFLGDDLGGQLTYLFGAIANMNENESVEWASTDDHLACFKTWFPAPEHGVWQFIEIEQVESEVA